MKGNTITGVTSVGLVNDRIASSVNLNGVYFQGGNLATGGNKAKYTNYLTLPSGTYFSSTSFTITYWVYTTQTTAVPDAKSLRIIDFSDADTKKNVISIYLRPGVTAGAGSASNNNAALGFEVYADNTGYWIADNSGVGFQTRAWTHVVVIVSTSGSTITPAFYYNGVAATATGTLSALPATTTIFTTNFIGK